MKNYISYIAIGLAAFFSVALSGDAQGQIGASGERVYSAYDCDTDGAFKVKDYTNGIVYNSEEATTMYVYCSAERDESDQWTNGKTDDGRMWVIDDSTVANAHCVMSNRAPGINVFQYFYATADTMGSSSLSQELIFDMPQTNFVHGVNFFYCQLPAEQAGHRSGVAGFATDFGN